MNYITWFDDKDALAVALVGGKNAALAQMIQSLSEAGIQVPPGFAVNVHGFKLFMEENVLREPIALLLQALGARSSAMDIHTVGIRIRRMVMQATMPEVLAQEITAAYQELSDRCEQQHVDVAVRSSATAEDLPSASFAGQQETYLHIRGGSSLLEHCKRGFASLYTDRAIAYRIQKKFDHAKVALSLGIQKMVRSDTASSGVAFSLDTESGFEDVVVINAGYGLGESIVQGIVTPDEFWVYKPTLFTDNYPILKKQLGEKHVKFVYSKMHKTGIKKERVSANEARLFCLTDAEVVVIARAVVTIEKFFSAQQGSWCPIDVEWAKDGKDGAIYIVQARPETVHSQQQRLKAAISYRLTKKATPLAAGISIGKKIAAGKVRIVRTFAQVKQVKPGDIVVTHMTQPDWVPMLSNVGGIITAQGGRTCHAAIVSRELGIPAIVGVEHIMDLVKNGMMVTIDCSPGLVGSVYKGALPFLKMTAPVVRDGHDSPYMMMLSDPRQAFQASRTPNNGVGLLRLEFIIAQHIKIHPLACIEHKIIKPSVVRKKIKELTAAYNDPQEYYVQVLAQGIATIAAAFHPHPVIVRLSDFKSNEYAHLLGGESFETREENPMLGCRGARRYYDQKYEKAFELECRAINFVRKRMGFTSVHIMVPFVRTVSEAQKVVALLAHHGLTRVKNGLSLSMMVETPENALSLAGYHEYFDHYSVGSNDLTQLTIGVDRDNASVAELFDESNSAVIQLISVAIDAAHKAGKKISICGQGPSDNPALGSLLLKKGIDTLVLTQDALLALLSEPLTNGLK